MKGCLPSFVCLSNDCPKKNPLLKHVSTLLKDFRLLVLSKPLCLEGVIRVLISRGRGKLELAEVFSGFYCSECSTCGHSQRCYIAARKDPQLFFCSGWGTLSTWNEASVVKYKWIDVFRISHLFIPLPNGVYIGCYLSMNDCEDKEEECIVPTEESIHPPIKWIMYKNV